MKLVRLLNNWHCRSTGMADIDLSDPTAPRSHRFDDFYFQPGQGIEESRFTFVRGCGLPAAWRDKRRFVVAETGFGTGMNFLINLPLAAS